VGKRNEYQPKYGDALWLGSKGRYGSWANTPCKQIQLLSRVKSLDGPSVREISPVGNEKVY